MIELLRSNDPVLLSWAEALLRDAGIGAVLLDAHMSVLEGSVGVLPRRLMVADDDAARAGGILAEAGLPLSRQAAAGTSEDAFLGGRLKLLQPRDGRRAGSDAVLLAAAVRARPHERVLDAGAGIGIVALALARRLPGVRVDALELQADLARLAAENARRNRLDDRVAVFAGDLAAPPAAVTARFYDHVVSNPPYHDPATTQAAPAAGRALARSESGLSLAGWIGACLDCLHPAGSLTLVQRGDRLDEVLAALAPAAGAARVLPLLSRPGRPAKRVIVCAVKGESAPPRVAPGLLLHDDDGGYTEAAEAVLRHGGALALEAGEA